MSNFRKQPAIGTDAWLSLVFRFFIIRNDIGLPLQLPDYDGDGCWTHFNKLFNQFRFNHAIGYPF
ncbi:MAG: hypothetical protein FD181_2859 [Prolixibacteraceae bacterium]|nr:MAG: hypothetical protein FD181_2859 [Prolixibacteraceae bacterium]